MIKIKKIATYMLSALIASNMLVACNTLDLAPEDWYGSNSYWQNKTHVESALLGLHSDMRNKYEMIYLLGESRGGTQKIGTASLGGANLAWSMPIKDNTLRVGSTGISNWYGLYSNLLHVNLFIKNVESADYLTESERSNYLASAHGIRAYYYFWLYRTYGGVPLVTTVKILEGEIVAEDLYTARSTATETLNFIMSEIDRSEELYGGDFTQEKSKSTWSLAATLALKGEIYLWASKVETLDYSPRAQYAVVAKDALSKVVGRYSLLNDFGSIFTTKGNDEVIMSMRFMDGEKTNNHNYWLSDPVYFLNQAADINGDLITDDVLDQRGRGGTFLHEYKRGLYDAFDSEDSRRDATFYAFYHPKENDDDSWNPKDMFKGMVTRKNMGSVNSNGIRVFEGDIHIYRYADILLLMAEAENMVSGRVASYINQIRTRAYGENWDSDKYGYRDGSFAENERAILLERDKEFVQEGKRWFDIVRLRDANGKSLLFNADVNYYTTLGETIYPIVDQSSSYMVLWPIDTATLNNDPLLKQTEGYI